jgi:chemotaxis-related protein WspB
MLYSQFFIEKDKYVIAARNIVEIVPCISLKLTPLLPDYVAGLLNYHGDAVPVIDLCRMFLGRPCRKKLSTRIIIVEKKVDSGARVRFGFVVEKATEMLMLDDAEFRRSVMSNPDALVDGPVVEHKGALLTKISVDDVFERLDERFFSLNTEMQAEC